MVSSKTVNIVAPKSSLTPRILDDDPAQLEMLTAVIAEMGYEALATGDPEEALQLVKRARRFRRTTSSAAMRAQFAKRVPPRVVPRPNR